MIAAAPARIERVSASQGSQMAPAPRTATRIARPPSFGVGTSCRPRSLGRSIAPIRRASDSATGTSIQATEAANTNAQTASIVSRERIEPSMCSQLRRAAASTASESSFGSRGSTAPGGEDRLASSIASGEASSRSLPSAIRRSSTAPISPLKIV